MSTYVSMKSQVLAVLESEFPRLRDTYGIAAIGVFGSISRGADTPDSDVDVLYRFVDADADFEILFVLQKDLEQLFGRSVELVSMDYVDAYIHQFVARDAILYGDSERGIA